MPDLVNGRLPLVVAIDRSVGHAARKDVTAVEDVVHRGEFLRFTLGASFKRHVGREGAVAKQLRHLAVVHGAEVRLEIDVQR